jgi:fused signal recognition particle receptor
MVLLIVLIVAAVLIIAAGTFIVTARRRSIPAAPDRPVLERIPPPAPAEPPAVVDEAVAVEEPVAVDESAAVHEAAAVDELGVADVAVVVEEAPGAPPAPPAPPEVPPGGPAPVTEEVLAPPRFRDRLGRARSLFSGYLSSVRSRQRIDESTWEELEEALILADVGVTVTSGLIDDLRARYKKEGIDSPEALIDAMKGELVSALEGDCELRLNPDATSVWLFVGVNGVGKTTTIGKLGMREVKAGHRVVMAAGDTFRAAAADQLELWADRVGASIIRGNDGGDPGAVVFDAVQHAAARGADLVLADTAGRLHTKTNLMEELKKVRRVAERPPGDVTEVLLVIDATTGQNGLTQARQFASAVGVTGVVLTKLDGTAKGGIVLAIRSELGLPIKLVGLGEGPEDLVDFNPEEFVDAMVGSD